MFDSLNKATYLLTILFECIDGRQCICLLFLYYINLTRYIIKSRKRVKHVKRNIPFESAVKDGVYKSFKCNKEK